MDPVVATRQTYEALSEYAKRTINLLAASPTLIRPDNYADILWALADLKKEADHALVYLENRNDTGTSRPASHPAGDEDPEAA